MVLKLRHQHHPVTDQLVAVDSLASDFRGTSTASCLAEALECSHGVSSAVSVLECPNDAKNHAMNNTLNSVLPSSALAHFKYSLSR